MAAEAERILPEEFREGIKNNITHFTPGKKWQDVTDSCDNLRIHFPLVYDYASSVWNSLRNVAQEHHNKKSCFIATAVFKDTECWEILALQAFRDRVLLMNSIGQAFVAWYYRNGPSMASAIRRRPLVQRALRVLLRLLARFWRRRLASEASENGGKE